ncbi:endo-1,4-beta-xylanase [Prosthecobacter sp.]|uniref:endo-1,4-beta-xylanase n=1 Tax=Prosthecobacter sp. TaxID=1965333 RepID=UPI002ABC3F3A|nr:endo-1,4-beta-xylanase [Prosthecobacter sp.]MDZ4401634.1 endo-1,4-beta-xylanase [Prosthecobacter sp.]
MKHPGLLSLFFFATLGQLSAVEIPPGGSDVRGEAALQANSSPEAGKVESLAIGKRITITKPDSAKAYSAQFTAPISTGIAKNERVLAIIKARVVGSTESGEVLAKLQLRGAPYTAFGDAIGVGIQREWTEQPVVFITDDVVPADKAAVVLLCGQKEQSIEVESVRVLKYPATTDVSSLPRAKLVKRSYAGREPDAPWRKAALERIEQHRKADLSMIVKGEDGKPLAGTEVKLSLRRHAFGFGSAVVAKRFSGESEDDRRYREIVDKLFSIVVFENDLKDGNWSPDFDAARKSSRNAELDKAFAWFAERHIDVRGHYLMQVATPFNLHGIKDNAVIRERTLDSVRERLAFVKDRVVEWDVINHPIAWDGADMLNKRPGLEKLDREVFTLARSLTKLPFFINEDQVFRPGPQHDDTFAYIEALNADGFTVAGLGNQAHFHESYLPSPEHLLAVTDRFARIVPHQSITEYDIVTTEDEELAADYTRDVLIAVFSHPAYTSFLLWGFWEGSHWIPEAASWNKDWSIRKRGEVLEEWIGRKWRTEVTLMTDANGMVKWRGFPGWYEVHAAGQKPVVLKPQW